MSIPPLKTDSASQLIMPVFPLSTGSTSFSSAKLLPALPLLTSRASQFLFQLIVPFFLCWKLVPFPLLFTGSADILLPNVSASFFPCRLAVQLSFLALSEWHSHSRACRLNNALFCLYLLFTFLHLICTAMLSSDLLALLSCRPAPPSPTPL